jgi:hypothetical protein
VAVSRVGPWIYEPADGREVLRRILEEERAAGALDDALLAEIAQRLDSLDGDDLRATFASLSQLGATAGHAPTAADRRWSAAQHCA